MPASDPSPRTDGGFQVLGRSAADVQGNTFEANPSPGAVPPEAGDRPDALKELCEAYEIWSRDVRREGFCDPTLLDVLDGLTKEFAERLRASREAPPEPTSKALMAAQDVLSGGRIGFDVHVHLTTGLVSDALQAAYAAQFGGGTPSEPPEAASETEAILVAMDAWESTEPSEKFDKACPPIVYGIARSAFRIGLRAAALRAPAPTSEEPTQ